MNDSVTIILANKRKLNETDKAYIYTTSGYGGKVFSIARKMVVKKIEGVAIQINEPTFHPATIYIIRKWMYDKIKEDYLDKMNDSHYKLINE